MVDGWVKLHKKILQWEWYDDIKTFRLFLHLLLTVNFEDKKWRGLTIKRGQRVISLSKLSLEINMSIQSIRTSISKLESTDEITSKSHGTFTLFTVKNYDAYQVSNRQSNRESTDKQHEFLPLSKGKNASDDLASNRRSTDRATENQQIYRKKRNKEYKKKKKLYLEFVKLDEEEILKLDDLMGISYRNEFIQKLNDYIGSSGKKYKSHYHTIKNWFNRALNEGKVKKKSMPQKSILSTLPNS